MGGLRKSIPLVYTCFLVGGAALAALPTDYRLVSTVSMKSCLVRWRTVILT
ncbi:hypothetical protein WDV93_01270 [Pantoea ananatis]